MTGIENLVNFCLDSLSFFGITPSDFAINSDSVSFSLSLKIFNFLIYSFLFTAGVSYYYYRLLKPAVTYEIKDTHNSETIELRRRYGDLTADINVTITSNEYLEKWISVLKIPTNELQESIILITWKNPQFLVVGGNEEYEDLVLHNQYLGIKNSFCYSKIKSEFSLRIRLGRNGSIAEIPWSFKIEYLTDVSFKTRMFLRYIILSGNQFKVFIKD